MLTQLLWIADVAVENGLEGLVALPRLYLILYLLGSNDYRTPVQTCPFGKMYGEGLQYTSRSTQCVQKNVNSDDRPIPDSILSLLDLGIDIVQG